MNEKRTQKIVEYLENALSEADRKSFCAQLDLDKTLRAQERGLRLVLKGESLAACSNAELPDSFEDSVMRRVRVATPPQAIGATASVGPILSFAREALLHPSRLQALLASTCALLIIFAFSPSLRSGLSTFREGRNQSYLVMYDAVRNAPTARIINAVTARIPPGYRAVSLDVAGAPRPGEYVDVMWLAELQAKSVSAIIVENARVLSNEQDPSATDNPVGISTVTILIPAADAARIELARATGTVVLTPRDAASPQDGGVEEFIERGGTLSPKA
ncbi:MAG: hypothetical protein J0M12_11175 [Deltaproteobacteria bacterium]|nr:hypothetical protein [Deltaproteobacteria bacterium]